MDLAGSVAFVTGGGGGLGAKICERLALAGADIAIGFRKDLDKAAAVADAAGASGRRAVTVQLDHSRPEEADAAVAEAVGALGGRDLLVNNAAMAMGGHDVPPGDLAAQVVLPCQSATVTGQTVNVDGGVHFH